MTDTPARTGPLVLIIRPGDHDTAELVRLPDGNLAGTSAVQEAIGGHFEAIEGVGGWIAYVAEDERDFAEPLHPNLHADALARVLGWHPIPGDYVKGVAVFMGREGVNEIDVPDAVVELARRAGIIK